MATYRHLVGNGKLRRFVRWGTLAVCAGFLLLYAASFRWGGTLDYAVAEDRAWSFTLNRGWIAVGRYWCPWRFVTHPHSPFVPRPAIEWQRHGLGIAWNYTLLWSYRGSLDWDPEVWDFLYVLPAWPTALAAGLACFFLARSLLHCRGGCPACGYNLAGLPRDSRCPECGREPRPMAHPKG